MHSTTMNLAPELQVSEWLNTEKPLSLSKLRGQVVILHAFQMLCPGCVLHGLPQSAALHDLYQNDPVQVIGLHSVFEHHEVMTIAALRAFASEFNLTFPLAVDTPSLNSPIPKTMSAYQLNGTPSTVLIDPNGRIRLNHFGRLSDMQIGDLVGRLLTDFQGIETPDRHADNCDANGCAI